MLTLIVQASPPYSYFNGKRYEGKTEQERFKWVEFYKWRFNAEWYTPIAGKLILKTGIKVGSLGYYNKYVGYSPFGRYTLGGDGLANRQTGLTGGEILALRGYETTDFAGNGQQTGAQVGIGGGGTTFAKYTTELRYPISLNPSSTIYALLFATGGNVWEKIQDFRPFDVRRSVGGGVRVFLPMFGTLGFDYGFGIDKPAIDAKPTKKLTDYGRFSIILGFEPD
jgi:outer membrane protein insertion porin family